MYAKGSFHLALWRWLRGQAHPGPANPRTKRAAGGQAVGLGQDGCNRTFYTLLAALSTTQHVVASNTECQGVTFLSSPSMVADGHSGHILRQNRSWLRPAAPQLRHQHLKGTKQGHSMFQKPIADSPSLARKLCTG